MERFSTKSIAEWIVIGTAIITVTIWGVKLDDRIRDVEDNVVTKEVLFSDTRFITDLSDKILSSTGVNVAPGAILAFAGNIDEDMLKNFRLLPCDGRSLDRKMKEYDALFSFIGTIYGGDGVDSFNLPDLQGRAIVCSGDGEMLSNRVLGQTFGKEVNLLTSSQLPTHWHSGVTKPVDPNSFTIKHTQGNTVSNTMVTGYAPNAGQTEVKNSNNYFNGNHVHKFKTENSNCKGEAIINMQPSIVLHYLIKY